MLQNLTCYSHTNQSGVVATVRKVIDWLVLLYYGNRVGTGTYINDSSFPFSIAVLIGGAYMSGQKRLPIQATEPRCPYTEELVVDPLCTFRVHSTSEVVYPHEMKGIKEHAQVQEEQQASNTQGQGKEQVSKQEGQGVVFTHEEKQEAPLVPKQADSSLLFTPCPLFEDYQLRDDLSSDVKSFGMCVYAPNLSDDHLPP